MASFAALIIRWRWTTILSCVVITLALLAGVGRLTIVIDPADTLPQSHPLQMTTNLAQRVFGSHYAVIVGLTPAHGTALQPAVLSAVARITDALAADPKVDRSHLISLTSEKAKDIEGTDDGIAVRPLFSGVSMNEPALREALARNPIYGGLLISKDLRTTAVIAEFRRDPGGFRAIARRVEAAVAPLRSPDLRIAVAGQPIYLGLTEVLSDRMFVLFPLALVIIGIIHFEAFRSWQGVVLPLVTGLMAVGWALGMMGWTGTPLDAFNASTPILVLAVAAGHAVQILKRYFEECRFAPGHRPADPVAANHAAIIRALAATGPVMIAAGTTAALSFASLMVFQITTIRVFGLFTALGIASALAIELTFIPALRAVLPLPSPNETAGDAGASWWDRAATALARMIVRRPGRVLAGAACLFAVAAIGASRIGTDNALRSYFSASLPARQDDAYLNKRLAGSNVLELVVQGGEDAIKSPAVLRAMQATQAFLAREPAVGKTVSLVDFIRQIDRAINQDANPDRPLPDDADLIAQYLLLYSMSGDPHDFDAYVDAGYSKALIRVWLRKEDSSYLIDLTRRLKTFMDATFPAGTTVAIGGNVMSPVALNEVLVSSKLWNIAQIGIAVFGICSLFFRSFLGGALVLVPLAMAVACNFGLMGWTGIPLQLATATVSAMAVGIGADYAIYLLYRLREEATRHDPETALLHTFQSAGKAIMYVATAIAGGYAVMMLSWGFLVHFWLGLLISVAMLVSAGAALTVLPALLMLLRPRFVFATPAVRAVPVAAPIVLALLLLGSGLASAQTLSADAVMQRNFVAAKVRDSQADATFTLISSDGQKRVRRIHTWTKLEADGVHNSRLVRFLSPPDVRGTATLTIEHADAEDDIWIYLPALKRVRRLLAENKKDSYVGTDFSYGDIIGFRVEGWNHRLVGQEKLNGVPCFVIESTPATPAVLASSGYARRVEWIRADNFITVQAQYFDAHNRLWKRFSASDIREVDPANNRWQPMHLEVEDVQSDHRTRIDFANFVANQGLNADLFNPRALDREQ